MRYNNTYNIEWENAVSNVLNTALRKPLSLAFVMPAAYQIAYVHSLLMNFRGQKDFRLSHNGQRCYLRGVLNNIFDPVMHRIEIGEGGNRSATIVYWRQEERPFLIPDFVVQRGFVTGADDFTVIIPQDLHGSIQQITAVTNEYKLASKKFTVIEN
ncbi:MAG: hypothetical protein LBT04_02000 [Prevotellaceae bacterium]|jgi:hypothetical protein|nr:hypothetical protein [Prevotellaceae bacterium]